MTPQQFKKARLRLGLTQKALADELGVHVATVQRYELELTPIPLRVSKHLELMEKMR